MTDAPKPNGSKWIRIGAVVILLSGLVLVGKLTGLTEYLSVQRVRAVMEDAGMWGFLIFVAVFCAGELIHVPGIVFVAAAVLAYGTLVGGLASLAGALASFSVSFLIVRTVGGKPLGEIKRPFVRRILARLDTHPLTSVAILRLIFWMAPALNYALAMSHVRFRDYFVGSVLGLLLPLTGMVLFLDWFLHLLL